MTVTKLLVRGNAACTRRDRGELANVARELSGRVGDPLRGELLVLATLCPRDLETAVHRWPSIRDQVELRIQLAGT